MEAILEPTPELFAVHVNGVEVPVRIWRGVTDGGIEIEAYVLSITPNHEEDHAALQQELPDYMRHSREVYDIGGR